MSYTICDFPQKLESGEPNPLWLQARVGKLTGSFAAHVMATRRDKKEAADRKKLRVKLAIERVTGKAFDRVRPATRAMEYGNTAEPRCRLAYEALTRELVTEVGFVVSGCGLFGCSPDGAVFGPDGQIVGIQEFKNPEPDTHWGYVLTGIVPEDYLWQCTHNAWVTGAEWVDWMSHGDDFPEGSQSKLVRLNRSELKIEEYAAEAMRLLTEVDAEVEIFRARTAA
jgi:hypothetical protein